MLNLENGLLDAGVSPQGSVPATAHDSVLNSLLRPVAVTPCPRGHFVKRNACFLPCFALFNCLLLSLAALAQNAPTKPLTIDAIFQPGGLVGRGPETTEWSPDGSKLTFVQRDVKGEKGEL